MYPIACIIAVFWHYLWSCSSYLWLGSSSSYRKHNPWSRYYSHYVLQRHSLQLCQMGRCWWQNIQPLLEGHRRCNGEIGGSLLQNAINSIKTECMNTNLEKYCQELLKNWFPDDDTIKKREDRAEGKLYQFVKKLNVLTDPVSYTLFSLFFKENV